MRVGARVGEDPAVGRHTERPGLLDRAQDEGRALLDRVVGVEELAVREPDHAVAVGAARELGGGVGPLDPGVGVAGRHLAEAGPQPGEVLEVLGDGPAVGSPPGVLEQGVELDRHHDAPTHLVLVVEHHLLAEVLVGRGALGLHRPVGPAAAGAVGGARAPGLGARDEHDVGPAVADVAARLVHQCLRDVAAHGRVDGVDAGVADGLADEAPGVGVAPREHVHHADRVGLFEQPGLARVGRGDPQGLGHERGGLQLRARPGRRAG